MNAPRRTTSENSYLRHLDLINAPGLLSGSASESVNKQSGSSSSKKGRILKIVVFVHGFQASFLLSYSFHEVVYYYISCLFFFFLATPSQCFHFVNSCYVGSSFNKTLMILFKLICHSSNLGENLPSICSNLFL